MRKYQPRIGGLAYFFHFTDGENLAKIFDTDIETINEWTCYKARILGFSGKVNKGSHINLEFLTPEGTFTVNDMPSRYIIPIKDKK